ncbi:MAG TPA: hypothetical protein VLT87_29815 [Thermoanaerobaculia bacterium]|nr:hypothetical protein [Thermoanaerobaculia bacterium]
MAASRKEEIERKIEEARFRLGPVRVDPWLGLREAAYVRTFVAQGTGTTNDFTATVGAGLRGYLRMGRKVIWSAEALPEYAWWQEQSERRRVNGRYGLTLDGFFNRLTLQAGARREEQQRVVTPEVPDPVSGRTDEIRLEAELRMTGALSAYAGGTASEQDNLVDDLGDPRAEALDRLDREERTVRGGVRWRPREPWLVGLGVEQTRTDFEGASFDLSNSGTSPALEVRFDSRRLTLLTNVAARSLEARRGSLFVDYDGVTGNAGVALKGRTLQGWLYGNRNLIYSVLGGYAYFEDERVGAALALRLGRRSQARVFAETGTNDYTAFSPATPALSEDVFSYGGGIGLTLPGSILFEIQALRSEFDANLPGADRSYTTVGTTVSFFGGR